MLSMDPVERAEREREMIRKHYAESSPLGTGGHPLRQELNLRETKGGERVE